MGTSETKMNPCFLPAHHPPKAVIRDVLCGGLEVILGGGLVIQQWPTAGLAVSLLAQAIGEGIVPGEERDMSWRWSSFSEGDPGCPELLHSCLHTPMAIPVAQGKHLPSTHTYHNTPIVRLSSRWLPCLLPLYLFSFPFSSLFS